MDKDKLYYKKGERGSKQSQKDGQWKLCVRSKKEKEKIMKSCHETSNGNVYLYMICIDMYILSMYIPVCMYMCV